jgi:hypothetical protein
MPVKQSQRWTIIRMIIKEGTEQATGKGSGSWISNFQVGFISQNKDDLEKPGCSTNL